MTISIPKLSLVVLVGPSGSGKSTFARTHFKPTEVVSSDACRAMLIDDENCLTVNAEAFALVHHIAGQRLALGKLTVIDATSVQPEARKPLIDLTAGRRQEFPQRFLAGYRGFVHADAYDGYNAVHDNVRNLGCWMHARRYFVDAEPTDPRAVEALAFVRTLYAVEREIQVEREKLGKTFTDADVVRLRRTRAGPILAAFADWLEVQHRSATPKSLFGQAVGYSRNQWASLVRYLDDARFSIDNGEAERAIRPLAVGRGNWLHVGGDGGLKTASVLLSVCASATRHRLNPWSYLRDVLDQLAARSAGDDAGHLLPDAWAARHARTS
jgi:energy-coupling factor transporter ATP-binding protein EcfA2